MRAADLIVAALEQTLSMAKLTLADFTDEDLTVRPVAGANTALWQLRHLIRIETGMVNLIRPGTMPALPEGFSEGSPEPATKAQTMGLLEQARGATVRWVRGLGDADLDAPAPERMRQFVPTVGVAAQFQATHLAVHLGQIQVIRRKLGKPVLV